MWLLSGSTRRSVGYCVPILYVCRVTRRRVLWEKTRITQRKTKKWQGGADRGATGCFVWVLTGGENRFPFLDFYDGLRTLQFTKSDSAPQWTRECPHGHKREQPRKCLRATPSKCWACLQQVQSKRVLFETATDPRARHCYSHPRKMINSVRLIAWDKIVVLLSDQVPYWKSGEKNIWYTGCSTFTSVEWWVPGADFILKLEMKPFGNGILSLELWRLGE